MLEALGSTDALASSTRRPTSADFVIIDTAPLGEVSDALKINADQVDDVLLVTRPGHTNRVNLEMMRDLLERTAYTPAGFLVIGDSTPRTSAYYAYGATSRELFLEPPEPTRPQPASRPPRDGTDGSSDRPTRTVARVSPRSPDREAPRDRVREAPANAERDTPRKMVRETPADAERETPRKTERMNARAGGARQRQVERQGH